MSLPRLTVSVGAVDVDDVCDVLESLGASALSIVAASDEQVLEPAPGSAPAWRSNRISALFSADVERDALTDRVVRALAGFDVAALELDEVEDRDWTDAWRQQAVSRDFGHGLWVLPHDAPTPDDAERVLRLDPGLAFGTGAHATTALCLEWLAARDLRDLRVLDLGCGSGILGIAAALGGAAEVVAVDHDPQALEATAENADRNQVASRVHVSRELPEASFDVVLANILANTLIELAPTIAAHHRAGGALLLSGLLESQLPGVWNAYSAAYDSLAHWNREGWLAASARRRNACT